MIPYTPLQKTDTVFILTGSPHASEEAAIAFLRAASRSLLGDSRSCCCSLAGAAFPSFASLSAVWRWQMKLDVATSWDVSSLISALAGHMPCLPQLSCLTDHHNSSIVPDPVLSAVTIWVCLGLTGERARQTVRSLLVILYQYCIPKGAPAFLITVNDPLPSSCLGTGILEKW